MTARPTLPAFDLAAEVDRVTAAYRAAEGHDFRTLTMRGSIYPVSTEAPALDAALRKLVAAHFLAGGTIPPYLKSPRFIDLSRSDYLMQRGLRTHVDPSWDARDAFLMADWTRSVNHARGFGRGYRRMQFCRAFQGCAAEDIRAAGVV